MTNQEKQASCPISRRSALSTASAVAGALILGRRAGAAEPASLAPQRQGRIIQAACPGAFGRASLDQKCRTCVDLGLVGIDLVNSKDWPTLKKYGLICTMAPSHSLTKGVNHKENHETCIAAMRTSIEAAADAGFPNVISFSGNREGLSDDEGIENCILALKQVAGLAEKKNVTICMELLNSKRNHPDYHCDHTAWGARVVDGVGSPRVKLLYDIYHMQVQEGDIIATIRENIEHIAHFHTAGVPGRHEIDDSQELYYPAIMRAIADLNFRGYVAHEYSPTKDPLQSLTKAVEICDV